MGGKGDGESTTYQFYWKLQQTTINVIKISLRFVFCTRSVPIRCFLMPTLLSKVPMPCQILFTRYKTYSLLKYIGPWSKRSPQKLWHYEGPRANIFQ